MPWRQIPVLSLRPALLPRPLSVQPLHSARPLPSLDSTGLVRYSILTLLV